MLNVLPAVVERLRAMRQADWREVAELSGVSFSTISKIAYGVIKSPQFATVVRLNDTLAMIERRRRAAERVQRGWQSRAHAE